MENPELKLRQLSLGKPSADLRDRIFNSDTVVFPVREMRRKRPAVRSIPLSWAAAIALICSVTGYGAGMMRKTAPSTVPLPESTVKVEIVKTTNPKNMFDFTAPVNDFLPGKVHVVVKPNGEV